MPTFQIFSFLFRYILREDTINRELIQNVRPTAGCPRPLPMNTASSGGTGRGWAPGMGSEMTRLDLEVCKGLVPPREAEPICWAKSMALSGSLLGSEQACCHMGIFCVRRSLPLKKRTFTRKWSGSCIFVNVLYAQGRRNTGHSSVSRPHSVSLTTGLLQLW